MRPKAIKGLAEWGVGLVEQIEEDFYVYPENWAAVKVFKLCKNSWNYLSVGDKVLKNGFDAVRLSMAIEAVCGKVDQKILEQIEVAESVSQARFNK